MTPAQALLLARLCLALAAVVAVALIALLRSSTRWTHGQTDFLTGF